MLFWELFLILFLIVLNGFFAMSELAVVSTRPVRLRRLARAGNRKARAALKLVENPTRFLSTVQIGITLVGVLAGTYSGATLAEPLAAVIAQIPFLAGSARTVAISIVVMAITYLSLVVGELVPKRIALGYPERIAIRTAPFMLRLAALCGPLVWTLQASTVAVLRLLGIGSAPRPAVTEEEIKMLVAEAAEAGVVEKAEREMVEGVLRLADRPCRSIMTPRTEVVWLDVGDSSEVVREKIARSGRSRFPVSRDTIDEFVGVVHTKDLLDRLMGGLTLDLAASAKQPLIVHEATPTLKLLDLFRNAPVHMAIIVDEYGSFEGLVTPTDILTAVAGELPEAGREELPEATRREDGSWLVDGRMTIDEVEKLLDVSGMSSDGDYTTLAGFVLWQLGHVPKVSERFTWQEWQFEVVDMDRRRIDKVLVRRLPAEADTTRGDVPDPERQG